MGGAASARSNFWADHFEFRRCLFFGFGRFLFFGFFGVLFFGFFGEAFGFAGFAGFGQYFAAKASLTMATAGVSALSDALNTRPRTIGARMVEK